MAFAPAFDSLMDPTRDGIVLTFILPAERCNLNCPVCVIRQRHEAESSTLEIDDYLSFIDSATILATVSHVAIQGYEPLLPETWQYTEAILAHAQRSGIPTSIVTNGIYLKSYASALGALDVQKITVSLDSFIAESHDKKRGVDGAFDETCANLAEVASISTLVDRIWVNSVLYPGDVQALIGMPALLDQLQIRRWTISPLIRIGDSGAPGGIALSREDLTEALELLPGAATEYGVELRIDDEFAFVKLQHLGPKSLTYDSLERVENLFRLGSDGSLSVGLQVLQAVEADTPRWFPDRQHAAEFLRQVSAPLISKFAKAS